MSNYYSWSSATSSSAPCLPSITAVAIAPVINFTALIASSFPGIAKSNCLGHS
nr:hypothetical protein [Clostridioides difficile]